MSNDHPSFGQAPSGSQPPSIGELFGRMTGQISSLIRGEIALAKTQAMTLLAFLHSTVWAGCSTALSWLWP